MRAIEALGLTKQFKDVRAVDALDLLVEEGQICGILGPNGAGKTTTLMMLLGVIRPDAGSVTLLGRSIARDRSRALEEVNFAASYLGLPDRLKIGETLSVYADLYGAPRSAGPAAAEELGITGLLDRFPWQLSSGQRTVCALARALTSRPRLLVLDEPTASLDPEVAARVRATLAARRRADGFTLLITSHNMADIERLCERVVFIAKGRVVADDTPGAVSARYGAADLEGAFLSIAAEVMA